MKILNVILILMLLLLSANAFAQDHPKYVGVKKCKACHMAKSKGSQFKIWEQGPHANALKTLGTPKAKEYTEKEGISGDPQKADKCLECHQTASTVEADLIDKGFKPGNGVECESCHGPGSLYKATSVMSAKKWKEDPEGSLAEYIKLGLIMPDEKVCIKCHNDRSPAFIGFNFEEFVAKIAHPNPKNVKK